MKHKAKHLNEDTKIPIYANFLRDMLRKQLYIKSIIIRNRKGKYYLSYDNKDETVEWRRARVLVESVFPDARLTSCSPYNGTFRLNPQDNKNE